MPFVSSQFRLPTSRDVTVETCKARCGHTHFLLSLGKQSMMVITAFIKSMDDKCGNVQLGTGVRNPNHGCSQSLCPQPPTPNRSPCQNGHETKQSNPGRPPPIWIGRSQRDQPILGFPTRATQPKQRSLTKGGC